MRHAVGNVAPRVASGHGPHRRLPAFYPVIVVRSGIAGIGIGNGDRAPGTHQQERCEHANTRSEAQTQ